MTDRRGSRRGRGVLGAPRTKLASPDGPFLAYYSSVRDDAPRLAPTTEVQMVHVNHDRREEDNRTSTDDRRSTFHSDSSYKHGNLQSMNRIVIKGPKLDVNHISPREKISTDERHQATPERHPPTPERHVVSHLSTTSSHRRVKLYRPKHQ